jgi:hypothetical protein
MEAKFWLVAQALQVAVEMKRGLSVRGDNPQGASLNPLLMA